MKRIGWSFLICWVCFSCGKSKSQEGNKAGQNTAATGNIRGIVSYKEDKKTQPDVGTTVYLVSTTSPNSMVTEEDEFKNRYFQTVADINGNYAFTNLPADTYTLVFKSKNAPRKLTYYKTRYTPAIEPLVNDQPERNLNGKQAKQARLDAFFKDQQVQVKSEVKLEGGATQIITQEFIVH